MSRSRNAKRGFEEMIAESDEIKVSNQLYLHNTLKIVSQRKRPKKSMSKQSRTVQSFCCYFETDLV